MESRDWSSDVCSSDLGVEGFAEGLRPLVTKRQEVKEIPKGRRFVGRPSLKNLFSERSGGKASRDPLIGKAITDYGYSQMEVASFLDLHYSTISRIVAEVGEQQK